MHMGPLCSPWNFGQPSPGDTEQYPRKTENSDESSLPTEQVVGWAPELVWTLSSREQHLLIMRVEKERQKSKNDRKNSNQREENSEIREAHNEIPIF